MQVLVCQHECVRELATRPGRLSPIENFLPLHYDYLQFAYYRGKAWVIHEDLRGGGGAHHHTMALISHHCSQDKTQEVKPQRGNVVIKSCDVA